MIKIDFESIRIRPSKHFMLTWMRKWDWDINDLREALVGAYKLKKVGKVKYEAYTTRRSHGKSRKLIFVKQNNEIFIIPKHFIRNR